MTIHEHTEVTGVEQHGKGGVVVQVAGHHHVKASAAVLAVNWRTLAWAPFARELSTASSHIVLTEPVPDVLAEIGWTGGEALYDCRRMLHYFRTTKDGRIAFGWGGGRVSRGARHEAYLDIDAEVVAMAADALRRFFPALARREITHAWGGPIDVAPSSLPIYRSRGDLHAGWGFTGHGVGPSHLGGRILSGLALGVRDEVTTLPLVAPPVKHFPPEPARWLGGSTDPRGADPQGRRRRARRARRRRHPRRRAAAEAAGDEPAALSAVPGVGIEPTRPEGQRILSPSRLPFRHPGRRGDATRRRGGDESDAERHEVRLFSRVVLDLDVPLLVERVHGEDAHDGLERDEDRGEGREQPGAQRRGAYEAESRSTQVGTAITAKISMMIDSAATTGRTPRFQRAT